MVRIRFNTPESERRALGFLAGRFNFNGQTLIPERALAALAVEGIPFLVEGPATYEQSAPSFRNPSAA